MNLPEPDHRPLENLELPLVVWQVRYEPANVFPTAQLSEIQRKFEATGLNLVTINQIENTDFVLGLGGPVSSHSSAQGWRLSTEDSSWHVVVLPGSFAIETSGFHSFADELRSPIEEACRSIEAVVAPAVLSRLGLRFINVLTCPAPGGSPLKWEGWVKSEHLGSLVDADIKDGVIGHEQRFSIRDGQVMANVRTAVTQDEGDWKLLLDIDAYTEPHAAWQGYSIPTETDRLNAMCVSLFQHVLTDRMLDQLRGRLEQQ